MKLKLNQYNVERLSLRIGGKESQIQFKTYTEDFNISKKICVL